MKYNVVRNGNFSSMTSVSGIGSANRLLSYSELQTISNNMLTSSGISISNSDSIMFQLNMSERIKIDGIRLYCDNVTTSGLPSINIYWKNEESDLYSGSVEYVGIGYYYAVLPDPSAPQYILATISGLDTELFEFVVYNDDYIVSFGTDGYQTDENIDDSPIGSIGTAQSVEIFNNSSDNIPATAYVCVDYIGTDADYYLEISNTLNGTYYSLEDGVLIEDNDALNNYIWNMGEFVNTEYNATNESIVTNFEGMYQVSEGSIPLSYNSYSWYVGQNGWDYDPVTKTIYAIGSDSILKLYKYPIDEGEWTYIGEVCPGCSDFTYIANMAYVNGYIYVLINTSGQFGRYDLSGAQDNWEALDNIGWGVAPSRIGMCSDKDRYVYVIHGYYVDNSNRSFKRWDTTVSGWEDLNLNYSNNAYNDPDYNRRACLAYDYDRDYIYADVGSYVVGNYIQRYDVSSDTWQTTWFNVDNYTNALNNYNHQQTHTYLNDYLVLGHAACDDYIWYYHISSSTISYIVNSLGSWASNGYSEDYFCPYILATDHLQEVENAQIEHPLGIEIYAADLAADRGNMYRLTAVYTEFSYTTPILSVEDKYRSSYIVIDNEGKISVDGNSVDTIEVRSSDTAPVPIYESYVCYTEAADMHYSHWIPYTNSYTDTEFWTYDRTVSVYASAVDPIDGRHAHCWGHGYYNHYENGNVYVFSRADATLLEATNGTDYAWNFNDQFYFDGNHGIWGYGNYDTAESRTLRHLDNNLNEIATYSESQQDFIYEIATETFLNGEGVWYTNSVDDTLVHMRRDGVKLKTIPLDQPRCICSTSDGGCWVEENSLQYVYRYNYEGNKIAEIQVPYSTINANRAIVRMDGDGNNGFWYRNGDYIWHVKEDGISDLQETHVLNSNILQGTPIGCFVHNTADNLMNWIDLDGSITSRAMPNAPVWFGAYYYGHDEFKSYKYTYLPQSFDPIWGNNGSLEWKVIPKNGYFLPKRKYHQIKITLYEGSTKINKIIMAPTIRVEDIKANNYKMIYLRTNIPADANIENYESGLRAWWDVED